MDDPTAMRPGRFSVLSAPTPIGASVRGRAGCDVPPRAGARCVDGARPLAGGGVVSGGWASPCPLGPPPLLGDAPM